LDSGRDGGLTLVELLVAMSIFGVLMALVFSLMIQLTYQASDALGRARSVEEARLGISQIDRQIRSGNVIVDPSTGTVANSGVAANYSLTILTQEGGAPKCAQWRVIDSDGDTFGELQFRSWEPGWAAPVAKPWGVVAHNVVAPTKTPFVITDPETWPPFFVDKPTAASGPGNYAENIRVTLRMKDPQARGNSKPIAVSSIVTGRNTVFGYSATSCNPIPAP